MSASSTLVPSLVRQWITKAIHMIHHSRRYGKARRMGSGPVSRMHEASVSSDFHTMTYDDPVITKSVDAWKGTRIYLDIVLQREPEGDAGADERDVVVERWAFNVQAPSGPKINQGSKQVECNMIIFLRALFSRLRLLPIHRLLQRCRNPNTVSDGVSAVAAVVRHSVHDLPAPACTAQRMMQPLRTPVGTIGVSVSFAQHPVDDYIHTAPVVVSEGMLHTSIASIGSPSPSSVGSPAVAVPLQGTSPPAFSHPSPPPFSDAERALYALDALPTHSPSTSPSTSPVVATRSPGPIPTAGPAPKRGGLTRHFGERPAAVASPVHISPFASSASTSASASSATAATAATATTAATETTETTATTATPPTALPTRPPSTGTSPRIPDRTDAPRSRPRRIADTRSHPKRSSPTHNSAPSSRVLEGLSPAWEEDFFATPSPPPRGAVPIPGASHSGSSFDNVSSSLDRLSVSPFRKQVHTGSASFSDPRPPGHRSLSSIPPTAPAASRPPLAQSIDPRQMENLAVFTQLLDQTPETLGTSATPTTATPAAAATATTAVRAATTTTADHNAPPRVDPQSLIEEWDVFASRFLP